MKNFIINIIKYMITHSTYLSKIYVDQNFNYGIRLPSKVVSVENRQNFSIRLYYSCI